MSITPQEIADLKTKMQAIIFSIEDGIVMTDFDGNILVINDRARLLLGIKSGYPYEKRFLEYLNGETRGKFEEFLSAPDETPALELTVYNERTATSLNVTKNLVTTAQGGHLGRVIALHDVTLEKELENLKDDFLQSITHDLKSPLTSLQGFLHLFMEGGVGPVTPDQMRYLKIMIHSSGKILRMINNILDMARMDAGRMSIKKGEWDILSTVDEMLEVFQEIARLHKIKVFKTIVIHNSDGRAVRVKSKDQMDRPITVNADAELLERVITNLVDNATKFTPVNGQIEIAIEDFPDKVKISVKDSGRGIADDVMKKLFHKYQQAPGTRGGTGLGLTIAKHIVEQHGGQIGVSSGKGNGSNFYFSIPKTPMDKESVRS